MIIVNIKQNRLLYLALAQLAVYTLLDLHNRGLTSLYWLGEKGWMNLSGRV
ncbi:hypothetical protein M2109_000053 [Paenibacillus sp. PastH-3]|nr:hypothetical protein [Paenibacillus sp. PastH-4]MDH6443554.1 hypothetical protein [Paenibacillus sp. PastF-4]MDH6525742.1 hypothetical protein [Paenibacillus sp. PastH-3]